jgi:hypothetical protein
VLPDADAVVYLDTDMIFLRAPELLAQQFQLFDQTQMFGMAPMDGYYSLHSIKVRQSLFKLTIAGIYGV